MVTIIAFTRKMARGAYAHLTDEQIAEYPVFSMSFLLFYEYYGRMTKSMTRDTPLFELQQPDLHKRLAAIKTDPRKAHAENRMFLLNPCEKKPDQQSAPPRLCITTPHAIQKIVLDGFGDHLRMVISSIEQEADKKPVATTLARQYAHDLILSLAQIATWEPIPYSSTEMLLMFHMYRYLGTESDNVYAAAISPDVTRLRTLLLDKKMRARIMVCGCYSTFW